MLKALCLKKVTFKKKKVNPKMWGKEEIGGKEIESKMKWPDIKEM